ncbi:MAG: hypothetical protein JWN93_3981 [Hyphomicrobiales bacterium]|nr:hypothetical protein [Hyphomicrobiales bacterium]
MTTFDQREQAFERKYVHDERLSFEAHARRNKRLALWAAELMRLPEPEAQEYAASLLRIGALRGDEGVFAAVQADLQHARIPMSDHRIRRRMDELLA